MTKLILLLRKLNTPITSKITLVVLDILAINLASILTVWIRFGLNLYDIPIKYIESILSVAVINTVGTIVIFALFHLYTSLWRYASVKEISYVLMAGIVSTVFNLGVYFMMGVAIFRSYFIVFPAILIFLILIIRFSYRLTRIFYRSRIESKNPRNTMIIGGGEACSLVMKELENNLQVHSRICCIIDDNPQKKGAFIHGVKIIGGREKIIEAARKFGISEIIVAIPSAGKSEISKIIEICKEVPKCELKILPGVYQLVSGNVSVSKIRNVNIEDLLGREVINVTTEKIGRYISDKVVLVTGGGGSIGSELCRQIAANGVRKLILFDIYENSTYAIEQELHREYPNLDLVTLIGSVRNEARLEAVFSKYRPDIIYHAAAHKHVPLMETSPNEAVKNNVFGTYKAAYLADKYMAEKFILISTDKAVNPTNIMGATKRICEMIIQIFSKNSKTEFAAVRFGNVLGSNGSVIPLFRKQIEEGGPVTVTHPDIIRYFMTIPEAVSLVLQAGAAAKGGEIFVLDMGKPVKIVDLAKNLIRLSGFEVDKDIEIKFTGLRPGEKLYEELLMSEEGLESTENELIFIGQPIELNEEIFAEQLRSLNLAANSESELTKEIVSKIVPTYAIKKEQQTLKSKFDTKELFRKDYVETSVPIDFECNN